MLSKTFLTGTIGYSKFQHAVLNTAGGISYVPLKIGLRHYIFAKMLYIHADAGLGIISSTGNSSNGITKFSGDFGAGVKFGFFELQADYDGFNASNPASYASWVGIKTGFNVGL